MASVYMKGPSWYAQFKDGVGRRRLVRLQAKTKTEAKRLAEELERKAERQRMGLEPLPSDTTMTLVDVCEWWLENRCPPRRVYNERKRLQRFILGAPIGQTPVKLLTSNSIEDVLREMAREELSPWTINGLRGTLHTVFEKAHKAEVYIGTNPLKRVDSWKQPKRVYETLRAEEVPLLLPFVPDDWRNLFVTALYTGMRKGELFGLRKRDVDLVSGVMIVARSYDNETTKGAHADAIPIAKPLRLHLEEAMKAAKGDLVFPDAEGNMRSPELDPQKILRHALARAGLVEGYDCICRRCKARKAEIHTWRHPDLGEERRCPQCAMRLWPQAVPRNMRFHDLRHTTATLLLRAGTPMQHVQRVLRHADIKLTVDTYGHLVVEDLRAAVDGLPASGIVAASAAAESVHPVTPDAAPFTTGLLPEGTGPKTKAGTEGNSPTVPASLMVGETGFEPATPWSRTKCSTRLSHSPSSLHLPRVWGPRGCCCEAAPIYASAPRESTTHTVLLFGGVGAGSLPWRPRCAFGPAVRVTSSLSQDPPL